MLSSSDWDLCTQSLKILHLNVQCIRNKISEIEMLLYSDNLHILCLCEHWLSVSEFSYYGLINYKLASIFCRNISKNDGVAVYAKGLHFEEIDGDDMEEIVQHEHRTLWKRLQSWSKPSENISVGLVASKCRSLAIRYVTIFQWLPNYTKEDGVCDFIAGISLGLMMLPQSIAYALLAGLSPEYGLYSSFVGVLVYVLLGKVKQVSIGVTSLMALLTLDYTQELSIEFVILLTFLSGCVELLFGILHLGTLVDFISEPVVSGFTTAASVITAGAQMKSLLGINYKSFGFLDNIWKLFHNLQDTKISDTILGCSSIIFLIIFRNLKDIPIRTKKNVSNVPDHDKNSLDKKNNNKSRNDVLKKSLWYLSLSRNAIIVLIGGVLGFIFEDKWGKAPFALSGQITAGFPPLKPPPFSTTQGNVTYNFVEMVTELKSGIVIVPIISVLSNVAIAKAYSIGENSHPTQEMITLGLSNILASFVSSMPMCAGFSRSAVSNASGVRTPLAGLYTGSLIILAIGFLTPYFYYIPRSTLAAVLISAVVFMADFKIFTVLWNSSKRDFFAAITTFVACLGIGMEIGLLIGVAINCSFLLYFWARPVIHVEHKKVDPNHECLHITPDAGFYFPSAEYVRIQMGHIGLREGVGTIPVVVNCKHIKGLDYSAAKSIGLILREFKTRKQPIFLMRLKKDALLMLRELGVGDFVHYEDENDLNAAFLGDCADNHVLVIPEIETTSEGINQPLLGDHSASQENDASLQLNLTANSKHK